MELGNEAVPSACGGAKNPPRLRRASRWLRGWSTPSRAGAGGVTSVALASLTWHRQRTLLGSHPIPSNNPRKLCRCQRYHTALKTSAVSFLISFLPRN